MPVNRSSNMLFRPVNWHHKVVWSGIQLTSLILTVLMCHVSCSDIVSHGVTEFGVSGSN